MKILVSSWPALIEWVREIWPDVEVVRFLGSRVYTLDPGDVLISSTLPTAVAAIACRRGARYYHANTAGLREDDGATAGDLARHGRLIRYRIEEVETITTAGADRPEEDR